MYISDNDKFEEPKFNKPLGVIGMSEKLRKKLTRERLVYDYPKTAEQQFANQPFPPLFQAVYGYKQDGFPAWFRQERDTRWKLMELLEASNKGQELIIGNIPGSRNLGKYYNVTSPKGYKSSDIVKLDKGIESRVVVEAGTSETKTEVI